MKAKFKRYQNYIIFVGIMLILLIIHLNIHLLIIKWVIDNLNMLSQLVVGGILGGIIATFIVTHLFEKPFWEEKFNELKEVNIDAAEKYEELSNDYKKLSEKNDVLLERLPEAIGGPFTESLFKYPTVVSEGLAQILSKLTDKWYQQYHKRVLVSHAEDVYKIIKINTIENAGVNIEGDSMAVWELDFLSTWDWVNDSSIVKYPLHDFMIVVSAPDEAIENLLDGITTQDRKNERKKFFDFIRNKNMVRSIVLHKDITQRLSGQAVSQMLSIGELDIKWGNKKADSIKFENFESVPHEDLLPGIYNIYKLPKNYADKPLEPGQEVAIRYRGRISVPVHTESNHRTGKLFLSFPDLIAEGYTLTLNYPESAELEGLGKSVKIVEDKSGIWFGYERLNQPQPVIRTGMLHEKFAPKKGEAIMQLSRSKHLTDLNYIIMCWEEAS
jgi:hypothetical protein